MTKTVKVPSPAISIVGRHNSGKTTRIEQLIAELVARGHDVGSVKHHTHSGFDIDIPGKDSYRHRAAGASDTVIAAPGMMARVKTIEGELELSEIVNNMPGHDVVVVEGYRKSDLPTIEVMRSGNPADVRVAEVFVQGARSGWPLGTDFAQLSHMEPSAEGEVAYEERRRAKAGETADRTEAVRAEAAVRADAHQAILDALDDEKAQAQAVAENQDPEFAGISNKLPTGNTVAIVTDIPEAAAAAALYNIPAFDLDDTKGLADFVEAHYCRPRISVVIQAGGESRRMGRSKATVPFAGRPLICRLVERLSPAADELIITTNEMQNLEFLHEMYPELNIKLVSDAFDYRGALPGLFTALSSATNPFVAVVACDMVFASARLVVAESMDMIESGADVVVPVNRHGYEPFHAMYRRATCLPAIRRGLDRGEKRAQSFFSDEAVTISEFPHAKVLAVEPMGGCFVNANTPQELQALEDGFAD